MNIQYSLPAQLKAGLEANLADWTNSNKVAKLWAKDASIWTGQDEAKWLGWLDIVERQQASQAAFDALAADVKQAGFEYALLLGMGGSSLCPEVFSITYGHQAGFPKLHIVDSTDPAQVAAAEKAVDLKKTVCIVASKSGSTLEPNILKQYFFEQMKQAVGAANAGKHFIAITDPGSKMEQVAKADGFRSIFYGDPEIGGRFSALSNFGMVPASVMGMDTKKFLAYAKQAVDAAKGTDISKNSAVQLGLILGTAHNAGQDKITFLASPEIYDLGAWLEQLIAESTGKVGKGITPVDREHVTTPEYYGSDRVFAYIRLKDGKNADLDKAVAALEAAGQPVVKFEITDLYELASQFFTWEIATAVAGSVMGINTFNQPDVEASKIETRHLTDEYEKTGKLAEHTPIYEGEGVKLFADEAYAKVISGGSSIPSLKAALQAHLDQIKAGDYFAALAYIEMTAAHEAVIQEFRHKVRDIKKVATCLGFGPRFLHSTGQDYKGGPNTGVFLQITADHAADLVIPDAKYTFGVVIAAQAAGDLAVLQQRGRRALRVHLGKDVAAGLQTLNAVITAVLG
ncbi:MAG: bifunctional transaldolase/phosoglucose isomerase [Acidobacteriaceae bacterium]